MDPGPLTFLLCGREQRENHEWGIKYDNVRRCGSHEERGKKEK